MASTNDAHHVSSFDQCVELARALGEGIPVSGWTACIEAVLRPLLPDRFELDGDRFRRDECRGVNVSDDGDVVTIFEYGDRFAEIPLDDLPVPKPLPATVALWISSYVKWRTESLRAHGIRDA